MYIQISALTTGYHPSIKFTEHMLWGASSSINQSSGTPWSIKAKYHVDPPWEVGTKVYINGPGHMTKMAT